MSRHYILKDGEPVAVDFLTWARWFEDADQRVAFTEVGDRDVSTVFLGLDYSFGGDSPLLFETMVFPHGTFVDELCERYSTLEEAILGHERIVAEVRNDTETKG